MLLTPPSLPHPTKHNRHSGSRAVNLKMEFPPATLSFEAFARKPGISGVYELNTKFVENFLKPYYRELVRVCGVVVGCVCACWVGTDIIHMHRRARPRASTRRRSMR